MNRFTSILCGILVFLITLMPYETMAQNTNKTAYQKRMEQIDKEMAQKFGYSEPNDIVALEILNGMAEYLKGQNTSRAKIYSWYINEQEKAKKLKTQADFDREAVPSPATIATNLPGFPPEVSPRGIHASETHAQWRKTQD